MEVRLGPVKMEGLDSFGRTNAVGAYALLALVLLKMEAAFPIFPTGSYPFGYLGISFSLGPSMVFSMVVFLSLDLKLLSDYSLASSSFFLAYSSLLSLSSLSCLCSSFFICSSLLLASSLSFSSSSFSSLIFPSLCLAFLSYSFSSLVWYTSGLFKYLDFTFSLKYEQAFELSAEIELTIFLCLCSSQGRGVSYYFFLCRNSFRQSLLVRFILSAIDSTFTSGRLLSLTTETRAATKTMERKAMPTNGSLLQRAMKSLQYQIAIFVSICLQYVYNALGNSMLVSKYQMQERMCSFQAGFFLLALLISSLSSPLASRYFRPTWIICLLQFFCFEYRLQLALVIDGRNRLFRLYSSQNWQREVDRSTTICGSLSPSSTKLLSAFSSRRGERKTSSILGSMAWAYCYQPIAALMWFLVDLAQRSKKEGRKLLLLSSFLGESLKDCLGMNLLVTVRSNMSFGLMLTLCFLLTVRLLSSSSLNQSGSSSSESSLEEPSQSHPTFIRSLLVHSSRKVSGLSSLPQKYFLRVVHMLLPMSRQCLGVKWCLSLMELQKECSMVQLQGRLRMWWRVSLAVPSLPSRMPKLHWQQLKEGTSLERRQGICLERKGLALFWHPYMKIPFFLECACRSMNMKHFFCSRTAFFVQYTQGLLTLLSQCHTRFKSYPDRLQRQLPLITPSGLSIGTILKMKWSLSFLASSLFEIRKLMMPSQTNEAGVSPGCTRLVMKTTLLSFWFLKLVMVSSYTQFPPGDSVRVLRLKIELKWWSLVMLSRYLSSMVKVQGGLCAKQVVSASAWKSKVKERLKQVLPSPIFMLFLRYFIYSHWRSHRQLLLYLQTATFMPFQKEEQGLARLRIWNLILPLKLWLCTLKKNHWVHLVVLISFWSSKQYSFSLSPLATMARLPLSNRLQKASWEQLGQGRGECSLDQEQQALRQAKLLLFAAKLYLLFDLQRGFSNSLLREGQWRVCCSLAQRVKGGARSKHSSEKWKLGSESRGKRDLGGTAVFFWIGLALGSYCRYSYCSLLQSMQVYYKIIIVAQCLLLLVKPSLNIKS